MKPLVRIVAITAGVGCVAAGAVCGWLFFYTADLRSTAELYQYAPATPSEIHTQSADGTTSLTHVLPSEQLGRYLVSAVIAAEGPSESRGPIRATAHNLLSGDQPMAQMYSWQVARGLVTNGRGIGRQIDEIRLAEQIYRHFDQRQLLTIYLNRVYFGENSYGVEDASMRYFGKHAGDLSLDEAALLVGLIRSPGPDSPIHHPERAVQRRNWVIDQMVKQGSLARGDAEQAKAAPLIIKQTADSGAAYDWNRCVLRLASFGSSGRPPIRVRTGERFTMNAPVITFEVLESGEVRNAVVQHSSGIADVDNYALASVRTIRYHERPQGCGPVESQAVVNVDF